MKGKMKRKIESTPSGTVLEHFGKMKRKMNRFFFLLVFVFCFVSKGSEDLV